jgi:hypothetical protein
VKAEVIFQALAALNAVKEAGPSVVTDSQLWGMAMRAASALHYAAVAEGIVVDVDKTEGARP